MTATILDALDDPALFAPLFRGNTWTAWRAFLAALFALPMNPDALALFQHHTGRQTAPAVPFKEAALICGRRGGKSRVLALLGVFLACFVDYRDRLAPGEVATVAIIAADRKQARGILRFVMGMLHGVPMLATLVEAETQDGVMLTNGVRIEIHTCSFRVTRGYSLVAALCDESAFWRTDESANPDQEVLAALRPGLANLGGLLLLASSPYAKRGALYQAFRDHYGKDDARVLVWRGTSLEMNPSLPVHVVEDAYEADPASAAAEYGAEWRTDVAAFVTREVVDACTVTGRYELPPLSSERYVGFVDAAGGSGADSMTLAIAHREGERAILDCVRDVRPPFSPQAVTQDFAAVLKAYRVSKAQSDKWGGDWVGEEFRKNGVTVEPSAQPKSDIYRDTLPMLNSGRCELLDLPRLASQLCGLERRTARGGRDSVDHAPGGGHDDVCNSVAGALLLASSGHGPMEISDDILAWACSPPSWEEKRLWDQF